MGAQVETSVQHTELKPREGEAPERWLSSGHTDRGMQQRTEVEESERWLDSSHTDRGMQHRTEVEAPDR